jgi:hypothetical protein
VALKVEGVVNRTVHAEEALGGSSRLEPPQLALASSDRLVRILRPVVTPKPLFMTTGQSERSERGGVGAQPVGDQQFRDEALLLEQLAHQLQRRPTVASALDEHVENLALVTTARQRYVRLPAMRTTISSKCQRSLGRGRHAAAPTANPVGLAQVECTPGRALRAFSNQAIAPSVRDWHSSRHVFGTAAAARRGDPAGWLCSARASRAAPRPRNAPRT